MSCEKGNFNQRVSLVDGTVEESGCHEIIPKELKGLLEESRATAKEFLKTTKVRETRVSLVDGAVEEVEVDTL